MTQEQQILSQLHRISETLTKMESGLEPLTVVLLTSFMVILGIIVGAFLNYYLGFKSQERLHTLKNQQKSFGELMGLKFLLAQLYVSRFEALIYSDYHEAKWKLSGHPKESIDFKEAQRWMYKSEDLAIEIGRTNNQLFSSLGLISTVFPKSKELSSLINSIYSFRIPKINVNAKDLKLHDLEEWKTKAVIGVQKVIDSEIAQPIDKLLNYLIREK